MQRTVRTVLVTALLFALGACVQLPQFSSLTASAGSDRTVQLGDTVVLDGRGSTGEIAGYIWALESQPVGSTAELSGAQTPMATLVPDLPGAYRITLTVSDATRTATASVLVTAVASDGMMLPGDPAAAAASVTFDLAVPLDLKPEEVETDRVTGEQLLRTEIAIEFLDDVAVGDVNRLLTELDAKIVVMTRGVVTVVAAIPDPGSAEALETLLKAIRDHDAVADAWATYLEPEPPESLVEQNLGTLATPPGSNANFLAHHYAVRAHGAWNANQALAGFDERPWLVVADRFGDGTPTDGFAGQFTDADFASDNPDNHGYHVLGIIAAAYGGTASTPDRTAATGIFPEPLRIRVVDIAGPHTRTRTHARIVHLMNEIVDSDPDARIVVNTSLSYVNPPSISNADRNRDARSYVRMMRNNDLEGRVVHVTSAGNIKCAEPLDAQDNCPNNNWARWPAVENSVYTYAALGSVTNWLGSRIDPLEGVLVVENRARLADGTLQRSTPTCANFSSIVGGHISAIGRNVWSLGSGSTAMPMTGTSMASPQVAGLAALVWSLDTSVDASDVTSILLGSSRNDYLTGQPGNSTFGACAPDAPQPVIDALTAVLAAGGNQVRTAMADFDDDGAFDEADIQAFLAVSGAPAVLDYGRMDLNGDGITHADPASPHRELFDVDGDLVHGLYSPDYVDVTHSFDEAAMNDMDVLCALAFSAAYTGDTGQRNRLLGQPCGFVEIRIVDPVAGSFFSEGDAIGVTVEVTLNAQLDGHVMLSTGGVERDRREFGYDSGTPVTHLTVHHVCSSDPVIEVKFTDSATGLSAVDSVRLKVDPGVSRVTITGPNPHYVRVYGLGPGGDPQIATFDLNGKAHNPDCRDPFSANVDQSVLGWFDGVDADEQLGSGPTLTLGTDDFRQHPDTGNFLSRVIDLRATLDGSLELDSVEVRPCSSRLGLSDGQSAVAGYPECPFGAVMGSVFDALISTFGTIDPADIDRVILSQLHGLDVNRELLDRLDLGPCDPTHCDPHPPGFPLDRVELRDGFYGDRGADLASYLDQLFDLLESGAPEQVAEQLEELSMAVAADADLGIPDRTLFAVSMGTVLTTVHFFAPLDEGGQDGWLHFGFAGDPETLHARVDRLAPAHRALEGLLTALVIINDREQLDAAEYLDAAVYAASLEALAQARIAAGITP